MIGITFYLWSSLLITILIELKMVWLKLIIKNRVVVLNAYKWTRLNLVGNQIIIWGIAR